MNNLRSPKRRVMKPVSGSAIALLTAKEVMTHVAWLALRAEVAGDRRQRHVGDRRVEHLHERRQRQADRGQREVRRPEESRPACDGEAGGGRAPSVAVTIADIGRSAALAARLSRTDLRRSAHRRRQAACVGLRRQQRLGRTARRQHRAGLVADRDVGATCSCRVAADAAASCSRIERRCARERAARS